MHSVFRKEIFVNQIHDVVDFFNISPSIQKRIGLVATVIFCLFAAFGAIYYAFFRKKIHTLSSAKNNKNIPLNNSNTLNQYGISIPKNVPTQSIFTRDFKLKHSHLIASVTHYKGNAMTSFPITFTSYHGNNDALGILDAEATHDYSFLGIKRKYTGYRYADPKKPDGNDYNLAEALAEIDLRNAFETDFSINWIKHKNNWSRKNKKELVNPNLNNQPQIIHDLNSVVFQKLFQQHNQKQINDFSHGSELRIKGNGGAAMVVFGDTLSVSQLGEPKCIFVKGKNCHTWPSEDAFALLDDSSKNTPSTIPLSPTTATFSLKDLQGGYLVLASGKLFEVTSSDEVKKAVELMDADDISPDEMSKRLVYGAVNNGLNDFLNVAIVKL